VRGVRVNLRQHHLLVGQDPIATRSSRTTPTALPGRGSAFKATVYEHVVNLEIVDYPSTDILGVGEHLRFATGSFDAALSLNLLELVRDPFRCATELARLLRSGGKLYASAPFLKP
jgi:SAM-dependent methyltransferase